VLLSDLVFEATGSNPSLCYQCVKCTSGCPLADEFDLRPNQVMRCVQLGHDSVLESKAIWLCASCHACSTRCPQEIDVAGVMDVLRIESRKRGITPAIPEIARFNKLFMRSIGLFGRVYELGLAMAFNLSMRQPFRDSRLGRRLFTRRKMSFWPHFARAKTRIKKLAPGSGAVGYFPGCSLNSTSVEYGKSVKSMAEALDLKLVEPPGWVCCGSSPAHATDPKLSRLLPMKTIATVEQMGLDTVTSPCSACYSRFRQAELQACDDDAVNRELSESLGYQYRGSVEVSHLLDVIVDRVGLDQVKSKVTKPLTGLKVACYYGCLITRPARATGAENPEYPVKMEKLLNTLGAEPMDWSCKTECCGGSLAISKTETAVKLISRILEDARRCGAEAIVTMCPICHLNLDSRQDDAGLENAMPIFQATQLMALAFGQGEKKAAIANNLIDPRSYLTERWVMP